MACWEVSVVVWDYHSVIFSWYQYNIVLSYHHETKWLKSFLVPSLGFRHILSRLPPRQGSLPKNKRIRGNNFLRRTCQWRSNLPSSSKTPVSWKQKLTCKDFSNFLANFCSGVEKWNVPNHPKRVFPKFHADRSHPRGVNGHVKISKKNWFWCFCRPSGYLTAYTCRHWLPTRVGSGLNWCRRYCLR